ncbi:phosphatase PAP2 family protein [Enterovirga sp. DB1703]|uniref:Phosphatase PAP2 family protein n=1 Tax=Enterovirga aerilata TaxID=2730920 RepID=A0A849I9J0_9HYPH|nr:phosphatase PAP2 family protein [Enterovirga sp. DB1703]
MEHRRVVQLYRHLTLRLGLTEAGPLLTLALVGLFGWGFVSLAGEVIEGETLAFDRTLLLSLRNPANLADPIGPTWLEESARDFTGLGGHAILGFVTLSTLGYLLMTRRRGAAILVVAAVVGGMVASALLKMGFERPRPDLVPHEVRVYTASFPSGHAMLSAVTYLTLGALLARVHKPRRVKLFFLLLAIVLTVLIGASRVYLGVHWPSDVLAGWCVGAAWAGMCWYAALVLQRRGQVETEAPPPPPDHGTSATRP